MGSEKGLDIIIINNSDKNTAINKIVKNYRDVSLINTDTKVGFARASNLGAKVAIEKGAEYIICLNQDTIINGNLVGSLIDPLINLNDLVLSAPIPYDYEFKKIESSFIRWYLTQCPDMFYDALNNSLKAQYEVKYVSGACFAIKACFIKKYGFFDPIYFMYAEDEDLCRKIRYLGYKIAIVPEARFAHFHSHSDEDYKMNDDIIYWQRYSKSIFRLKEVREPFYIGFKRYIYWCLCDYLAVMGEFRTKTLLKYLFSDIKIMCKLPMIIKSRKNEMSLLKNSQGQDRNKLTI
jgi:GT2 family glycosyltransferase